MIISLTIYILIHVAFSAALHWKFVRHRKADNMDRLMIAGGPWTYALITLSSWADGD